MYGMRDGERSSARSFTRDVSMSCTENTTPLHTPPCILLHTTIILLCIYCVSIGYHRTIAYCCTLYYTIVKSAWWHHSLSCNKKWCHHVLLIVLLHTIAYYCILLHNIAYYCILLHTYCILLLLMSYWERETSQEKYGIQLKFGPKTFQILVRHPHHWALLQGHSQIFSSSCEGKHGWKIASFPGLPHSYVTFALNANRR